MDVGPNYSSHWKKTDAVSFRSGVLELQSRSVQHLHHLHIASLCKQGGKRTYKCEVYVRCARVTKSNHGHNTSHVCSTCALQVVRQSAHNMQVELVVSRDGYGVRVHGLVPALLFPGANPQHCQRMKECDIGRHSKRDTVIEKLWFTHLLRNRRFPARSSACEGSKVSVGRTVDRSTRAGAMFARGLSSSSMSVHRCHASQGIVTATRHHTC